MSIRSNYEEFLKRRREYQEQHLSQYFANQEQRYLHPFRIFGNLYYVGDTWVSAHIVDTGDGLLLFDAGNCGATALLIEAIWELGFRPSDVKWLILSHGHVDHIGAAKFFSKMFGTKIYLGAPDAEMFRMRPELSMIQDSSDLMDMLPEIDVEIQDGDCLKFGNTEIQFYLVPGHTEGCIACFFNVSDGENIKRVGYYGGFGLNTLQDQYLLDIGDFKFSMRRIYLKSIQKVRNEHVDIFMSNHGGNVELVKKYQYMLEHPGENPFLDERAWREYLDKKYKDVLNLIETETM